MSLYQSRLAALQKLQQDEQLLKLEAARAQLAQLAHLQEADPPAPPPPLNSLPAHPPVKRVAPKPYLVNLTGVGDVRRARIALPAYGEVTVQAGDVLPNHWHVLSIDDDGVVTQSGPGHQTQRIAYQPRSTSGRAGGVSLGSSMGITAGITTGMNPGMSSVRNPGMTSDSDPDISTPPSKPHPSARRQRKLVRPVHRPQKKPA
jgi:type IV pilus biogenesis protein PilP